MARFLWPFGRDAIEFKFEKLTSLPFLTLKSIVQIRDLLIESYKFTKYKQKFFQKFLIFAKICQKDAFYVLLFILSRKFGDSIGE